MPANSPRKIVIPFGPSECDSAAAAVAAKSEGNIAHKNNAVKRREEEGRARAGVRGLCTRKAQPHTTLAGCGRQFRA